MVTVTGWNEWVAQKYNHNGANSYANFVDTFNIAFSRDIEMMRDGGYSDNFFMQLAQNVRDFKYAATGKNSSAAMWMRQSVDWANVSAWDNVSAKYIDITADAQARNYSSVANVYTYTDDSARLAAEIRAKTGLYLSDGVQYGKGGETFLRMNIACPRARVLEGLERLYTALT